MGKLKGAKSILSEIQAIVKEYNAAEKAGDIEAALEKNEQLKDAIRTGVNSPKMPRAKPLSKLEIEAHAERMAPQVAGELTRKDKSAQTIAGKTQQQFKREQTLPVNLEVMAGKTDPRLELPYMTLEDQKGGVLMGLPGDPTLARMNLKGIGDVEFERPVGLHGGPRYGDDEKLWASNLSAASNFLNASQRASQQYGGAPVYASFMKMPSGFGFAQHYLESLLQYQRPDLLPKDMLEKLNEEIRKGYIKDKKKVTFPEFAGFENPELLQAQTLKDSNLRKHIASRLEASKKSYGLRPAEDVQFAVSHPELTNLETGAGGFTIGKVDHLDPLTESAHPTYSHDIAGKSLGQTKYATPYDLLYRDQLQLIQENPRSPEFNTLKLLGARQKIDDQLINELNEYQERMRQLIGKKDGGEVHMGKGGLLSKAARELEEAMTKLPRGSNAAKEKIEREFAEEVSRKDALYKVDKPPVEKGNKALAEARRILSPSSGKDKFLEPSKVKQRLYHGTTKDIFEFDPSQASTKTGNPTSYFGTFLSDSPKEAGRYASDWNGGGTLGGNIMPVHAQIKNPYPMSYKEYDKFSNGEFNRFIKNPSEEFVEKNRREAMQDVLNRKQELINQGYDGIVVKIGGINEYVPFDSTQIKSAIGNRGTYDINEADITKAHGGVVHMAEGSGVTRPRKYVPPSQLIPIASQEFPLQKPANVTEADMTPTELHPLAGSLSRGVANVHEFVSKPFGYANPPMEMASELMGLPAISKTLENYAYGTPNTKGSGQATRLNEEAVDAAMSLPFGAGQTIKAGVKGAAKGAKELAPTAGKLAQEFAESTQFGLPFELNVVKPKGGNWMDADKTINALKIRRPTDHASPEKMLAAHDQYWNPVLKSMTEEGAAGIANRRQAIVNQIKVNEWIDKKLGNYVKNELATPEDSIRLGMERRIEQAKKTKTDNEAKLAKMKDAIDKRKAEGKDTTLSERDYEAAKEKADAENLFANRSVSHMTAPEDGWGMNLYPNDYYPNQASIDSRIKGGFPKEGMSTNNQASKLWEDVSDYFVESRPASSIPNDSYMMKDNPWIAKVAEKDPNTPIYEVNAVDLNQDLEFRHMIDELQEAMSPTSVLPQNLRITEKDLAKMTVDDVSALSGKINAWRAAQKVKADKDIANNPAMHTFKEYTENNPKGVRWQQIKRPEGYSREEQEEFVRAATKYEGDLMRHCVGGAGHCDPLLNNEVEIFSLRDAKGEPHVTIEVDKGANAPSFYERNRELLEYPEIRDEHEEINNSADTASEYIRRVTRLLDEKGYEQGKDYFVPKPKLPSIREIKGKGNQKPNDEYIPFIQDFIKSGQWDEIDDYQNTNMKRASDVLGSSVVKALQDRGEYVPQLLDFDDAVRLHELYNPKTFSDITTKEDYKKTWDKGGIGRAMAAGGAVQSPNGFDYESHVNNIMNAHNASNFDYEGHVKKIMGMAEGGAAYNTQPDMSDGGLSIPAPAFKIGGRIPLLTR